MSAPDMIAGFYSGGIAVGHQAKGIFAIPFSLNVGLAMQDSSGQWWLLTIGTDGRLGTTAVTF